MKKTIVFLLLPFAWLTFHWLDWLWQSGLLGYPVLIGFGVVAVAVLATQHVSRIIRFTDRGVFRT